MDPNDEGGQGRGEERPWLDGIKVRVQQRLAGDFKDASWTAFIEEVALFLRDLPDDDSNYEEFVDCISGLIKFGIKNRNQLRNVSQKTNRDDRRDHFEEKFNKKGVPSTLANILFDRFVSPPTQAAAAAAAAAAATVNHHVNVAKGVFLLYRGDDSNAEPIGTAFVISKDLLLTACHNVVVQEQGESFSVVTELKVSPRLIKSETGSISTRGDQRGVSVHVYRYNTQVDWACLRRDESSDPFPFIIPVASVESDIPEEATTDSLFIYHCPIQPFFDDITMDVCHVMVKPAAVGIVGTKTIGFQNGAFPGSCGGPYMYRNKAIALHVDSVSTTKTADDFKNETSSSKAGKKRKLRYDEITRMVADSCVSSHASMGSGILLHIRSGIMKLLKDD